MKRYVTCCCAEDMQATMQASVDQMVGFATLLNEDVLEASPKVVAAHTLKVCEFIQSYLDDYAKNHGAVDVAHALAGVEALAKHMVG